MNKMNINTFRKHKKYNRLAVAVVIIIILLSLPFVTYRYWLPKVAEYLIVQDELIPADVIVVMSGRGSRYQYAIRLFKEGYARYIMFNYNGEDIFNVVGVRFDPEEMIKNLAISNGIPLDRIFTDGRCTSTYEDMLYARENIIKNQFKSAIFVSNNFHMRRVYLTFKKVFSGSDVKPIFICIPLKKWELNPDGWWTREQDLIVVFNEYIKLLFYYFKYGI